ncbi:MAG: DNA-processing protein DprA [Calditrichia bacterium]
MNKNSAPKLSDLLYLLTIPRIGPGRIRRLFQVFHSLDEILQAPLQNLLRVEGIEKKLAEQIKTGGSRAEADRQLELIQEHGVKTVSLWDEDYPAALKNIPDPPLILFYRGLLKPEQRRSIAVVGTRSPSNYGKVVTAQLVQELCRENITIISGMARGVDAVAHRAALQNGGETLAVLGCGIERCYPPDNRRLYQDIPQQGAILSEFFIGTGPDAVNFPRRNRVISGLSAGTLVIEAGDRSGALITAYYALNHNREVFAVPGNINNPKSNGANRLLKQGAKLVQSVDDILEEISDLRHGNTKGQPRPVPEHLSGFEKQVLEQLSGDPIHIDRLVQDLQDSPSAILTALLTLELSGLVQQLAGKMFVRL